jgi:NAD(P)-dependent dehydrogenase (short-subunit alcohol dehydrogenase family)
VESSGIAGKAALITGASRGIGLAIARKLATLGAGVCITARGQEGLARAVGELQSVGEVIGIAGKADDEAHQDAAVTAVLERYGRLDFLVNNAGTSPHVGPLMDAQISAVTKTFAVNVIAPVAWTQRAWSAWMSEHGGAVVNVASTGGIRPAPSIGAYNVSKAAMIHLTQQLAVELGPKVRVNAIAPGLVKTQFARPLYEGNEAELAGLFPMKRLGLPDDVAGAAAFLLGAEASWITGAILVVDGGELTVTGI